MPSGCPETLLLTVVWQGRWPGECLELPSDSYGACLMLDAPLYILFLYLIFAETFEVFCHPPFLIEEQLILVQVHSAAS